MKCITLNQHSCLRQWKIYHYNKKKHCKHFNITSGWYDFGCQIFSFSIFSKKGFSDYDGNKYTSVLTHPIDVPNGIVPKISDLEKGLAEYSRARSGWDREVLDTYCAEEVEKDKERKRWMLNSRKIRRSRKKDYQKKYKNKRTELKIDSTSYLWNTLNVWFMQSDRKFAY